METKSIAFDTATILRTAQEMVRKIESGEAGLNIPADKKDEFDEGMKTQVHPLVGNLKATIQKLKDTVNKHSDANNKTKQ